MKKINRLLQEYGESHQNSTNKAIHWLCVPLIFLSFVGLLFAVKFPFQLSEGIQFNLAFLALCLVMIYYIFLSWRLSLGMLIFASICFYFCDWFEKNSNFPLWQFSLLIFVFAWIGQFYGHKIEGKKPSFLKDVQFLLIGPAWLMSFIYKKAGIKI
jgi:uncharacterized membrane protein YGL010W